MISRRPHAHVKQLENNRPPLEKAAEHNRKASKDIGWSWLKPQSSKLENPAIPAQYTKQVTLRSSYSCKIQVLPADVIIISVCCDVL